MAICVSTSKPGVCVSERRLRLYWRLWVCSVPQIAFILEGAFGYGRINRNDERHWNHSCTLVYSDGELCRLVLVSITAITVQAVLTIAILSSVVRWCTIETNTKANVEDQRQDTLSVKHILKDVRVPS
uniref:Uncharacterized protein n=1 Tax=Spongospora subterranea TaxID=70186 RepID=A0A0H5QTD8_9EUKA|eukprot:CRZ05268.1 hypothetical protein [Spongospora subterranea]